MCSRATWQRARRRRPLVGHDGLGVECHGLRRAACGGAPEVLHLRQDRRVVDGPDCECPAGRERAVLDLEGIEGQSVGQRDPGAAQEGEADLELRAKAFEGGDQLRRLKGGVRVR